jgi:4,5-DOPA dioxygenase extradiol
MTAPPMPAAFIGHGSPMNAIEANRYTEEWRAFGASVPRPRVVLAVSAHWYIDSSAVTAMPRPRTIHDFYGFPKVLFDVEYPAPGLPELFDEIAEIVAPTWVGRDFDMWGLDHGTWSILVHAFPDADIPVVQLAINARMPADYHLQLGAKLAPLRERGVLILGSGNVVHNLGQADLRAGETGTDWNHRFDEAVRDMVTSEPEQLLRLAEHPDYPLAVPTPDHYYPLLYIAGLAGAAGRPLELMLEGFMAGTLSMTSYTLDLPRCSASWSG